MPRVGSIMLTNLSRYTEPRKMAMPEITINRPIIFTRLSCGVSFASRSKDKIYVSSDSPKLLGSYLSQFLHQKYVPDHIPAENKSTCFKSDIDNFLLAMKAQNIKKAFRNYYSINLSDGLRLNFITQPGEIPAGLDLISKAWALFEIMPEKIVKALYEDESAIDRMEQNLRNYTFIDGMI